MPRQPSQATCTREPLPLKGSLHSVPSARLGQVRGTVRAGVHMPPPPIPLAPARHGKDQPQGCVVPSCLWTGQVPSSSSVAEAEHRSTSTVLRAVRGAGSAPLGTPRHSLSLLCSLPTYSYNIRAHHCVSACPPMPPVPPSPPHQWARLSACRPPNPTGTRATHHSPALLGKALRFHSDNLELRGGSLQGEAAGSGLPREWQPRMTTAQRQGLPGWDHSREADPSFQIYPHF